MELSQLAFDIIAGISFALVWLPLVLGLIFLLVFCMFVCIQDEHLKKDYFKSLSDEDKKVVINYFENTSYLRLKRRLRRIKKNLDAK